MNLMASDLDYGQSPPIEPNLDPYALAKALSGRHLLGGQLLPAASGQTFEVVYPAPAAVIGFGAAGDAADVDRAVTTSAEAQTPWAKMRARDPGHPLQQRPHRR